MPGVDFIVSTELSTSVRARQVCSMFDVPPQEKCERRWKGDVPLEDREWNVGLIVGPSGCGKSSVMRQIWGEPPELTWAKPSMVDDFDADCSIAQISAACGAVGFNTIPAWLRPFRVLSNGEQFRADLARRLCELPDPVVVDEFTSVVDRQVAKIGAHAVQKWSRRGGRQFVAVTCHYDVIDWLQPDWVLEPTTMKFAWRSVQRRPTISAHIRRINHDWWRVFAPYHYLTGELTRSAKCFGLFVEGTDHPVAFLAALHRPHARVHDIVGISRVVVLPDWQGVGLAFILMEAVGAAYRAVGKRFHNYPAHPPFIRSHVRSRAWKMVKQPGTFSPARGTTSSVHGFGGRPCGVFKYVGPPMPVKDAQSLVGMSKGAVSKRHRTLRLRRKPARVRK